MRTPDTCDAGIIGAGPAGLVAARDLALLGYPVTIFEKRTSCLSSGCQAFIQMRS